VAVGYSTSLFLGLVDFSRVIEAPWLVVPEFGHPQFNLAAILFMIPVAIAPIVEHVGGILAIGSVSGKDYTENPGLHRTLLGDGLAVNIVGLFGGPPVTTYGEVTGAVMLTRHYNPAIKLPGDLAALESEVRERLRRDFDRGHIAVSVRWTEYPEREAGLTVNLERARAAMVALRQLKDSLSLPGEIDLAMLVRQPEVLGSSVAEEATPVAWADLEKVIGEAARDCRAMRLREGRALAVELGTRLDLLETGAAEIGRRAPERLVRERDRLRQSVAQLLDGRQADENRLAQELAFLADKLDITEELVRFAAHVQAVRAALAGDQPVGKQLGFLAQELGREVNTMGSKANDAVIAQQVIVMKGELEKFREQLENLE